MQTLFKGHLKKQRPQVNIVSTCIFIFYCKRSRQDTNPQCNPQLLKVVTRQRAADRFNLTVRKLTLSERDNQEFSLNTPGGIHPWPDQLHSSGSKTSQPGRICCMKHDLLSPGDTLPAKDCGSVSAQVCSWVWTQWNSRLSLNWVDTYFHVGEFMAQEKLGLDIQTERRNTTKKNNKFIYYTIIKDE